MKLNGARYVDEYCFELRRSKQSHQINEYKKAFLLSQLKLIGGSVGFLNVIELIDDYCDAPAPALLSSAVIPAVAEAPALSRNERE